MKKLGLIGFPLSHSFSKKYFTSKFQAENITGYQYDLYEIQEIASLPELLETNQDLVGLNVTIPHKQAVIPFMDRLDASAQKVGAVNVIKIDSDGKKTGYNSDYFGFSQSLQNWLNSNNYQFNQLKALVLGTGGASKAVTATLDDLGIKYQLVSRAPQNNEISYTDIDDSVLKEHLLIINTTPLGMSPRTDSCPAIPYQYLSSQHLLYDLVYNPEKTLFLEKGEEMGSFIKNGLEMLHLQAEKAWEIWQTL